MKRILWNDLETTGIDPQKHSIIQIACLVERENKIIGEFESKMRPYKEISERALEINNLSLEEIKTFPEPEEVFDRFQSFLDEYGYRKEKELRYIPAGYNNSFDLEFLKTWCEDMSGNPFVFWEHLQFNPIDPLPLIVCLWRANIMKIPNCKLETVAEYLNIHLVAHDAMSDVKATREITKRMLEKFYLNLTGKKLSILGEELTEGE